MSRNIYGIHYSRQEYREVYLQSDEWKEKRSIIAERDSECRICDNAKTRDVHHLTYERLPFENLDTDLIGVCRKCHNKIHRHKYLSGEKDLQRLKFLFFLPKKEIDKLFPRPKPQEPRMVEKKKRGRKGRIHKNKTGNNYRDINFTTNLQGRAVQ